LLLPAADFLFFRFKRGALQPVAYVALLSELAGYLFLRGRFVSTEPGWLVPPTTYFVKQFLVIPYTVFVHPWNRAAVDVPPVILCASAISLVVLLLLAVVRSPSARVISGPAVILISTVPLYGYFFVAPDLAGSRYLYFASVGWSLLIAELSMSLLGSERLYSALIAGLMVILAASLGLNLGPWRTAADLVETMTIGLRQARSTGDIVQDWQARQGTTVELKDGIPWKYKGVGIFSNGYPEFARLAGP
jgi:hypothetical protein